MDLRTGQVRSKKHRRTALDSVLERVEATRGCAAAKDQNDKTGLQTAGGGGRPG